MADLQTSGAEVLVSNVISKRQRRPSVRLNEIGDQSADSYLKRTKQWRTQAQEEKPWRGLQTVSEWGMSKTRPLGNLSSRNNGIHAPSSNGSANKVVNYSTVVGNVGDENQQGQFQGIQGGAAAAAAGGDPQNSGPVIDAVHGQIVEYRGGQSNGGRGAGGGAGLQVKARSSSARKAKQSKGRRGGFKGAVSGARFLKAGAGAAAVVVGQEGEEHVGEDGFTEPFSNASYEIETPEGFRDFEMDTSDSPGEMKESSELRADSAGIDGDCNMVRTSRCPPELETAFENEGDELVLERRDHGKSAETTWAVIANSTKDHHHHGLPMEYIEGNGLDLPSDTDTRSKQDAIELHGKRGESEKDCVPGNARHRQGHDNGVAMWLNGLGLGRYYELFKFHEVDSEVLPMLTLEDLRDMGITAVGSRRKMYNAIQKIQKNVTL